MLAESKPKQVKKEGPSAYKNWQLSNAHGEVREPIKHDDDDGEEKSTHEDVPIRDGLPRHLGSKEDSHGEEA